MKVRRVTVEAPIRFRMLPKLGTVSAMKRSENTVKVLNISSQQQRSRRKPT